MSTVLLRQTLVRADGTGERLEAELDAATITLGSAPDCLVNLAGTAGLHAVLKVGSGSAVLKLKGANQAKVNGSERRSARLKPGDIVEIGAHRIEVFAPPAGFDLGLDVQQVGSPPGGEAWLASHVTSLEAAGMRRRPWVWRLAIAILLLFLAAPFLFSLLIPRDVWEAPWLLTHAIWNTGELSVGHRFGGDGNCSSCHKQLFRRVTDPACSECHRQLNDHAEPDLLLANGFRTDRCAACHREHNDPSTLLSMGDAVCVDCHGRSDGIKVPGGSLHRVTGFTEETHSQFSVSFPVLGQNEAASDPWETRRVSLVGAKDASNLKFPHDVHLDVNKVTDTRTGEALGCASCHAPATDGEHFLPIEMERHCESCHELGFDDDDPFRRLPHGQAREAILVMEGHFLKQALAPPARRTDGFTWRRIPDRPPRQSSECARGDIACANRLFTSEVEDQFLRTGCVTCHEVTSRPTLPNIADRFSVTPVRLASDYMPHARFSHAAHRVVGDKAGAQACLSCHGASESLEATDLLVPGIDNCLECHADASRPSKAPMACGDCHVYHPPHAALNASASP